MSKTWGLMADLHLHPWSAFAKIDGCGLNSRLVEQVNEIRRCARAVRDAGGDLVVLAGDVFHVRGSVAPTVLNLTRDTLRDIHQALGVKFIIMAGNHDLEGRESTRLGSAVTALECDHVRTLASVGAHALGDDSNLAFIPWVEGVADLKEKAQVLAGNLGDARASTDLILHAPIDGVIEGLPDHGLTPEFLAELGFRRVFSGHYHNHKTFLGGKVVSIGALGHYTWSDVGSRAGFLLVDDEKVRHMASHLPKFVDLTRLAKAETSEELLELVSGNYVRVRVEASKVKEVEEARAELLGMGAAGVLVQPEPKPEASETRSTTIKAGASLEASVSDYIKTAGLAPPAEDIAREALAILGSVDAATI